MLPSQRGPEPVLPAPSARSVLLTVAGEMLKDSDAGVWTTAFIRVLGGLGIEDHAARQVLSRSAQAGWLERTRSGRAVQWRLAPSGWALVRDGVRRSDAYLAANDRWDGRWLVVHVMVPNEQSTTRKRLHGGLHWLGMGNLCPGLWLTPHTERLEDLRELISSLGLEEATVVVAGTLGQVGVTEPSTVDRAWDLTDLTDRYRRLLRQERTAPDPADRDHLLLSYLDLLNLQQRFMRLDPQLPEALLPDWIGREAAQMFRSRRERWGPAAHNRFWEIVDAAA
jgi:phenylacetic acid degradation operon negative regulatory protein